MGKIYKTKTSDGELQILRINNLTSREIIGFFPVDRSDCACQPLIKDLMVKFSIMRPEEARGFRMKMRELTCPADKTGKQLFYIRCNNCKAVLGRCYASDETLSDWVDLHYISTSEVVTEKQTVDKTVEKENKHGDIVRKVKQIEEEVQVAYWQGCLSVNISPIDLKLGFECACGADTRDFRANQTLPDIEKQKLVKRSSKGRALGKKDSQFLAEGIDN